MREKKQEKDIYNFSSQVISSYSDCPGFVHNILIRCLHGDSHKVDSMNHTQPRSQWPLYAEYLIMFYEVQSDNIACFYQQQHNYNVKHSLYEKYNISS